MAQQAKFWSDGAAPMADELCVQIEEANRFIYVVYWSRSMLQTLQTIPRLAQMPASEPHVWDALLALCDYDPDSEVNRRTAQTEFGRTRVNMLLGRMDDIMQQAALRLWVAHQSHDFKPALQRLEAQREAFLSIHFDFFAVRTVQFLREAMRVPPITRLTHKILQASPLPLELVGMVNEAILELHGIARDFLATWSVPRPSVPRCIHPHCEWRLGPPSQRYCPGLGLTCPERSHTAWWGPEHCWVYLHWSGCWKPTRNLVRICRWAVCDCYHGGPGIKRMEHVDEKWLEDTLRTSDRTTFEDHIRRYGGTFVSNVTDTSYSPQNSGFIPLPRELS